MAIVIYNNLTWGEATNIEKELIVKIGRVDKGLGTLVNRTNGGEGIQRKDRWTFEEIKREALKHTRRSDFFDKVNGAYKAAVRIGVLEEVCSHIESCPGKNPFKLTKEKCWEIALQFDRQTDLIEAKKSVYNKIVRLGWGQECFSHMKQKIDKEYCKDIALRFDRRTDLMIFNKYIYRIIIKNNWGEELFSHMKFYSRENKTKQNLKIMKTRQ